MSHRAWVSAGFPLPSCRPPPALLLLSGQPRRLVHFPHHSLPSRKRCRSCHSFVNLATASPSSSGVGDGRAARARMATGSSSSLKKWLEQALGQRLNLAGVASFARLVATEEGRRLAIPHARAPDIRWVDWQELARHGFRGVVFDKDNTLTAPYSLSLWPPISPSFARCVAAFPGRVAVISNSAGLYQYDPDGSKATALEESIGGIHVIRHETKKPAGTVEGIEKYFGCSASHLIMVGDRCFTDVVYGNQNGFLTILTEPLTLSDEPFTVQQVRKLERYLVSRWRKKGLKPLDHVLLLQCKHCIKSQPL